MFDELYEIEQWLLNKYLLIGWLIVGKASDPEKKGPQVSIILIT